MKFIRKAITLLALPWLTTTVVRADQPDVTAELLIQHGAIVGQNRDGRPVTATLHNLLPVIHRRFPNVNITLVGVDDILIQDLTLEWKSVSLDGGELGPPMLIIMQALRAACGNRFRIADGSNEHNALLLPSWGSGDGNRVVDVFYVGNYVSNVGRIAPLQIQLDDNQMRYELALKTAGEGSPKAMDLANQTASLRRRIDALTRSKEQQEQVLDGLRKLIDETFHSLEPQSEAPNFAFHAGSNSLVVIGTSQAIEVARKVITAAEHRD